MKNTKTLQKSITNREAERTQGQGKSTLSKKKIVKMLMQPLSKKNEKFKGIKITLADLKTPLF